jgi:hypothetical protein
LVVESEARVDCAAGPAVKAGDGVGDAARPAVRVAVGGRAMGLETAAGTSAASSGTQAASVVPRNIRTSQILGVAVNALRIGCG